MSRERKENIQCWYCGRTGIKYITEEYRNGSWNYVSSAVSDGWSDAGFSYLCPRCDRDPKAHKAWYKADQKNRREGLLSYVIGVLLALVVFLLFPGISIFAAIFIFIPPFIFERTSFKTTVVLTIIGAILLLILRIYIWLYNPELLNVNTPQEEKQEIVKVKQSAYLDDVDDISSLDELGDFYFSIANKFYYNDMGLKGTEEQVNAGNKLMVRVYDFLGTSAKHEKMLNIDSMTFYIKDYTQVSDYRKKKALEELQLGIDKIETLNE